MLVPGTMKAAVLAGHGAMPTRVYCVGVGARVVQRHVHRRVAGLSMDPGWFGTVIRAWANRKFRPLAW